MDISRMHESMEVLTSWLQQSCLNGPACFDPCLAGQVSDILKDLSMAMYYRTEQKCLEEMMEEAKKSGENKPYGYDHWHYASGKFAPTGHGHRVSGYTPRMAEDIHFHEPGMSGEVRMGYPMDAYQPSKYGVGYDSYQTAKRHYTESRNEKDKQEMTERIDETVLDSVDILREMWKDATPESRMKMKQQVKKLCDEITVG